MAEVRLHEHGHHGGNNMDFKVFSAFYLVPLFISAIGSLIEFRGCEFNTFKHALGKAFFLAFRSMMPGINIFSAVLYLVGCGTYALKKSSFFKNDQP